VSRELDLARARARMTRTGTLAAAERLQHVTARFTNPRGLLVLEPLTHTAFAALLRKLLAPGSTKEARTILDRLEKAGYELFIAGVDDERYRHEIETARSRASRELTSPGRFRRPRVTTSTEYR
jgi:hypothetical protein